MIKNFDDILARVKGGQIKKVAVAVAQDEPVLEAIKYAKSEGIVEAILIGNEVLIKEIAERIGMDLSLFKVINEEDEVKAAMKAVELTSKGEADMVMKGITNTANILRAVLNKEIGLRTGKLISHVAVFEIPGFDRLILISDAAFNMYPDLEAKAEIIKNAVDVANALGLDMPKVAPVCAVEVVNPSMPPTVDAAALVEMNRKGDITGCIIDGPFALDNAISEDAARHKRIGGPVAGRADILVLPNIDAANIMYKTLTFTTNSKSGAILMGASAPVILTSRADSFETKVNSIALASLVALDKSSIFKTDNL